MKKSKWMLDREYPDEYHSLPMDDVKNHEMSGACWCIPKRKVLNYGKHHFIFVWYHNAADGRSFYRHKDILLQ